MKFSFHLGVHATDDGLLIKSLQKNPKILAEAGVNVSSPPLYLPVLAKALEQAREGPASQEARDVVLETVVDGDEPERVVFSSGSFLCAGDKSIVDGLLYHRAGEKTRWMANLFPSDEVEFFLSVRNLATWIPAMVQRVDNEEFQTRVLACDPELLFWSDVIRDIREANPSAPVTIWCNEDTPLIWPEVMHEVAGIDPQIPLMGGFAILSQIMAKEGIKRLRTYLGTHPPQNEIQRRRVLTAFLDKYALEDEVEDEVDLPGWTPEIVERLTQLYEDDLLEIARMPGVTLLTA